MNETQQCFLLNLIKNVTWIILYKCAYLWGMGERKTRIFQKMAGMNHIILTFEQLLVIRCVHLFFTTKF